VKVSGNLLGLRPATLRLLERLADRGAGAESAVTPSFAVALQEAVMATGRRIGCLVDRRGGVQEVVIGDAMRLPVPRWARKRVGPGRLGGIRLIHARPDGQGNQEPDLETLRMLSLDALVAVIPQGSGNMPKVEVARLLPDNGEGRLWEVDPAVHASALPGDFAGRIRDLEEEIRRTTGALRHRGDPGLRDAAFVVLPVLDSRTDVAWETAELQSLCRTAGLAVVHTAVQRRARPDPTFLVGKGMVRELAMMGLMKGVDLLVFGRPLTPSQQRSIAQVTEVRVIDRNQLILDIFARHARSPEGRLQVELAQLRYNLPRLSEKDDALSRLTGGIGAQGPGETRLEMERRRARDRIRLLEKRLEELAGRRHEGRRRRQEARVPLVALVGYTNAGKSTLFNTLTGASVRAEDRLFATLDPTVRRAWLEEGREVLLADTVGFIRDLPAELEGAFRATLEEVREARALLLVADAADPHLEEQVASVRRILREWELDRRPTLLLLNQADRVGDPDHLTRLAEDLGGIPCCAKDPRTLDPVRRRIGVLVGQWT